MYLSYAAGRGLRDTSDLTADLGRANLHLSISAIFTAKVLLVVETEAKPKQKFIKIFFWVTKYCDLSESGNRPQIIGIAGGIRNIFGNDQSWSHLEQYYHGHGVVYNFTIGPQLYYSLSLIL